MQYEDPVEGACRHLVHDRMGITGARWGLPGAQAILWLRAIHASGDPATYWDYHIAQEHQRNHLNRYQTSLPTRRMTPSLQKSRTHVAISTFFCRGCDIHNNRSLARSVTGADGARNSGQATVLRMAT